MFETDAEITAFSDDALQISGTLKNGGVEYACRMQAWAINGTISADETGLFVTGADDVTVLLSAATNYRGGNPHQIVNNFEPSLIH